MHKGECLWEREKKRERKKMKRKIEKAQKPKLKVNRSFQKCSAEGRGFKTKSGIKRKETVLSGCLAAPGYC